MEAKSVNFKQAKGIKSAFLVILCCFILAVCIFHFVLGNPANFMNNDPNNHPLPGNMLGTIYKGGVIVPVIQTLLLTVLVLSIERAFAIGKAKGKGNVVKFVKNVKDGDIMVGGWNFGCGSSREHAPVAIKAAGISVVIAKSFARIFYRNSINIGLPIMECPEAVDAINAGDTVSVDFDTGVITDETNGKVFHAEPFPPFIQEIISAGGLMKSIKAKQQ